MEKTGLINSQPYDIIIIENEREVMIMKIKLTMDCGYVGTDVEEEMEVDDNTTEKELEELAEEFFWENFHGSYGYEIVEE